MANNTSLSSLKKAVVSLSKPYAISKPKGNIISVLLLFNESTISFNKIGTPTVANLAIIKKIKAKITLDLKFQMYGNIFSIFLKFTLLLFGFSVLGINGMLF